MVGATASLMTSEAAAGGPGNLTGLMVGAPSSPPLMAASTASAGDDDNAIMEPEVVMGYPNLRPLR
jgi:hypothetical protein